MGMREGQTDTVRHTDRHTDVRDQYTFRIVADREMSAIVCTVCMPGYLFYLLFV